MVHALLGEHQNVVNLLLERLQALRDPDCDLPRVVVLSGPSGSGKTRIVQELYARLRSEREDVYWPALGDVVRTRGGAGTDPMAGRKIVMPTIDDFVWPPGALPTFGWWGLNCERLSSGTSQDVVSAMRSQLEAHTLPLTMARRQVEGWTDKTRRLTVGAVDEVRSAFVDEGLGAAFDILKKHGISIPCGPTLVKWGIQGLGVSWRTVQEFNRLKKEILLGEQVRSALRTASQELAGVIVSLSLREIPVIVAIEDMHLMGRELPAFLDAVSSRRSSPVLVIGTVWPEGESNGVYRRWLNKAQKLGVAQRTKIPVLGSDELSSMIQEEAPRTSEDDLLWISGRLNNPFLIRLWLSERRTWEHIEGHHGAVVLKDEGFWLPEDVVAVLKGRWDELDGAVSTSVLYAAAISPDVDGSACRFVSEVVVGVVNREEGGAHYDVRMGLKRAKEKLRWCRSEKGVDFFVEPLLAEYLRRKADNHFGKEGRRRLRLLTQAALAEWICCRADGINLPPDEVSIFVCRWFLGLDEGRNSEELILARAAAHWRLAQNADLCEETSAAIEHGKKVMTTLLAGSVLPEQTLLNVRATVADHVLRGGEVKDALSRYDTLLPVFERVFGIHHPKTMLVRYSRAKAIASLGRLEDGVEELRSLLEDQSAVLGSGHPDSWATRSKLVELLNRLGRLEESLALCNDGDGMLESGSVADEFLPAVLLKSATLMGDKRAGVAIDVCRDLLSDMENKFGFNHVNVLEVRSNLAAALKGGNMLEESIREYRLLIKGYGRMLGPDHPDAFTSRGHLGIALRESGRVREAIEVFEALLADRLRVLGPDHPDTLTSRGHLGIALRESGRVREAIEVFEALLADRLRVLGPDHPDTLTSRGHLGAALIDAGYAETAIEVFEALLADRLRVLGPDHPGTLTARGNLAGALRVGGRVEESVSVFRDVLHDQLRVLGSDHIDTLTARANLGIALRESGRPYEAIDVFRSLLSVQVRLLGEGHPKTLLTRHSLAFALWEAGYVGKAVEVFRAVLVDQVRVLGVDHPSVLTTRHNLASVLRDVGREGEASEIYRAVLVDQDRVLGGDHIDTLTSRRNVASLLRDVGDLNESVESYRAVLNDFLRVVGPSHPDTLMTHHDFAGVLRDAGRVEEAIEAYQVVLDGCLRVLGLNHPITAITRDNLVEAFQDAARFDEAVSVCESIVEVRLSSSDPDDPDVLDARDDLAWALGYAKRFDEALADYIKLIADYERVMGADDPDTLTARNNYICTLKNSGKIVEAVALYRELLSDVKRALGADDEFAQAIAQRLSEWGSDL